MNSIRTAARKMTAVMFPDIKISYTKNIFLQSEEILSSLPLQMCLHYNCTYSTFWMLTRVGCLFYKFAYHTQLYKVLISIVITLMTVVEILRLYLGIVGNLKEKVPELAGFWMLTLFLQLPLQLLYTFSTYFQTLTIERATDSILILFLILEVAIGYFTVKAITSQQALKFKFILMKDQTASQETFLSL
ncbi:transmembrane protein 17 [Parasteatoda tepidariorum]|nr:transmembrane protein 17 [Parasteatoda tepidariorum]